MSLPTKLLRWLFWGLLALYGATAIGFLALRYWVLPQADQWRPRVEAYASQALGKPVTIARLQADWSGLHPRLRLWGLRVDDAASATPILEIPSVSAVIAWRSLFTLSPRLLSLRADGADIRVRRDAQGAIWVAGQRVDSNAAADDSRDGALLAWLGRQRELAFSNITVRWQDELRQAPELAFTQLQLRLRNGLRSHRLALQAKPPTALAAGMTLRADLRRGLFSTDADERANWSGELFVQLDNAELSAWQPWLDVPRVAGRLALRGWLQVQQGELGEVDLQAQTRDLAWQAPGEEGWSALVRQASWQLAGLPGDFLPQVRGLASRHEGEAGLRVAAQLKQAELRLPGIFETPEMRADELEFEARLLQPEAGQPLQVALTQLQLSNDDLQARLHGRWRAVGQSSAGTADLSGELVRARANAIHRYLPLEVNADARQWLASGLPKGDIAHAAVTLQGDLYDFPFSGPQASGAFRIAGAFSDLTVDYAPPEKGRKGWPKLQDMRGQFAVDKVSLTIDGAPGGTIETAPGQHVALGEVKAQIPDMEEGAELFVDAQTSGPAPAYLALVTNSPLGELLDDVLNEASGTGNWSLPLKLQVPLLNVDDTRVQGKVVFDGNRFRLMPEIPVMEQLRGELMFSELGVRTSDLTMQFLGGPARVNGRLEKGSPPLNVEGTLAGEALTQIANVRAMTRFSGRTAYRGQLSYAPGGTLEIHGQSNLKGLAIDMPAPVGKRADELLPLTVHWGPATDRGSKARRWLSAGLGENTNVLLERDPDDASPSYFARGALGVNRAAALPQQGLSLAMTLPELDGEGWDTVIEEFDVPASPGVSSRGGQPTLPPLERVSLKTARLRLPALDLTDLALSAQRPAPAQWRVELDARQAAGTLEWAEASGAIAGHVVARLKHLALGGERDAGAAGQAGQGNELSDIPGIDLRVQQFSLGGKALGALHLVGINQERGRSWRLETLTLENEDASLQAVGQWRLHGAERGLSVQAKAQFQNLGKFLDRVGAGQVVAGGSGKIDADLTWRDLPWSRNLLDITGKADVSLDKGRFLNVNSRTARVLEVLSFQSLQRLARLDLNPANLLKEGFPFEQVRGEMALDRGEIKTPGYKISGPVADITLSGSTNIISERWDLKAVVVPNLDASGAAVATAALVNPLIGLGAFVTQWLLKHPLERAMTLEYQVQGSWDDPKVQAMGESEVQARRDSGPRTVQQKNPFEFEGGR